MNRIYLDMDGVLADFDQEMLYRGVMRDGMYVHLPEDKLTPAHKEHDRKAQEFMATPEFWLKMPMMQGAGYLLSSAIAMIGAKNVFILTAFPCVAEANGMVSRCKHEWAHDNLGFPGAQIITCLRAEKKDYAIPDSVLVDDMEANCAAWKLTGNRAVLYRSAGQAVHDLRKLMEAV